MQKVPKAFIVLMVGGFLLYFIFSTIKIVQPGTVSVVTRLGQVTGRVLRPGPNVLIPLIETTLTYNTQKVIYETTAIEKQLESNADYKDYPVDTNTKDGQQVDIYYTVRFSVDPNKVTWIAQNIGDEKSLVEKIVKTDSRIWTRTIPREYEADLLYTGNVQEVQNSIEDKLKPVFSDNGILLDEVGIREIKFAAQYVQAIEAKQIEAVKIQTERNKAEQAKFQKESLITQAEGQARQQELLRLNITAELLQKTWIEKWDGKLPSVMGQNSTLMDVSQFLPKQ